MFRFAALALAPILTLILVVLGLFDARPARAEVTLRISCSALGIEQALCRSGVEAWAAETGNRVELVSTPADANQRLALYQTLFAARSPDIDVFQIDVVWPGILAGHLIDLAAHLPAEEVAGHLPALVENNRVDGRLVALPWFLDLGLLYYRRDLLQAHDRAVPRTWQELTETAAAIVAAETAAGNTRLQGFVWQGRAYEGLTCTALEWVASHGGGTLVEADGRVSIDNDAAARALARAAGWVGTISPRGVLNYAEEEARGVFQSGDAVFMRNWPYAWALANAPDSPVRGRVGVAALPRADGEGMAPAATLGGQHLAVSRYSAYPEAAIDLVRHLAGPAEQKRRAIEGAFNPTLLRLYADPQVLAANPVFGDLAAILERAVARPSSVTGRRYNQVSSAFVRAVHAVLSGRAEPRESLSRLAAELRRLGRNGRW